MEHETGVAELTKQINLVTRDRVGDISAINRELIFLAMNAMIEAARAGESGRGFAVVATEVKEVSARIQTLTASLQEDLNSLVSRMVGQLSAQDAQRLVDLALGMIDVIDRNLYERSCDVRWWATDSAVVECAELRTEDARRYASERLGVILDSYTVYLDLWILDLQGHVMANGRPGKYKTSGMNMASTPWFRQAVATRSGADYAAAAPEPIAGLGETPAAIYATAIREGGRESGKPIGVMAVLFDWAPQAEAVTRGVRLSDEEWQNTRCMIVDANHRVIASSDGKGLFEETMPLKDGGQKAGYFNAKDGLVAFALTPGYETYDGMGWYGVIRRTSF